MPFPEVSRVLYKKNPLDQVICQLRFPPILRIDAEVPAAFQEIIRTDFPNFEEHSEVRIEQPTNSEGQIPKEILRLGVPTMSKNYEFSSEDGNWKVHLTRTFIALTSNSYQQWEQFQKKLIIPFDALVEIYSPMHFSRVGLRYVDIIRRSVLGLSEVPWGELLTPPIAGLLSSADLQSNVRNFDNRSELQLDDGQSFVQLRTKLVEMSDDGESAYVIDSDFFKSGRTEIKDTYQLLAYYHTHASRLIQWCITERLHNAMKPERL